MSIKDYFKIDTDKIYMTKSTTSPNTFSGKITLTNKTGSYLIYKVMINKSKLYTANPACSFIAPFSQADVIIKRMESEITDVKGDFFLFKAYPTSLILNSVSILTIITKYNLD
jgi:hypothetical protein